MMTIVPLSVLWLRKAEPIPPGARWVTAHPHGPGTEGTRLLIQETKQGSGTFHVIGGAGGKLNYMRFRPSQHPGAPHLDEAKRRADRADAKRARVKAEKEAGTYQEKQGQRKAAKEERTAHEKEFIGHVASAMGWQGHEFDPDAHADLSDKARAAAERMHHRAWLKRANAVVNRHKAALLHDADARARALGHDPLEAEPGESLDVSDLGLQPTRKAELGTHVHYAGEALKRGVTPEEIADEAKPADAEDGDEKPAPKGADIAKELEAYRLELEQPPVVRRPKDPGLTADREVGTDAAPAEDSEDTGTAPEPAEKPLDTETLLGLVKAQKVAKAAKKAERAAQRDIDEDRVPKGAFHLAVSDVGMDEVRGDILQELRTASTRAFLSEVGAKHDLDQRGDLGAAMVQGAHGAINSVALTVAGAPLLDPMVVDTLGIAGAAQVLARKLKGQLSHAELDELRGALGEYHTDHYLRATEAALKEARTAQEAAEAIDIDQAATGADLESLKALNDQRAGAIRRAQSVLGRTLGEMEANAAMVAAFDGPAPIERLNVPVGQMTRADAITRARAIGLEPGDYEVHTVGQDQFLEVGASGLDKLTAPVARADLERYRRSLAIQRGDHDEAGWLPQGVANRPDLAMDGLQPGVAPELAEPFRPGPDLAQSIRDYIGGRTADGDAPAEILSDLHSAALAERSGNPDQYWAALNALVPSTDAAGNLRLADAHADAFQGMADEFARSRHGGALAPLHRQRVHLDALAVDAVHRALSQIPEARAAYKPIGDLTHQERRGLRQWFEKHVGSQDEKGRELAEDLHKHEAQEPEKTAPSLFGDDEPNPQWDAWKRERDQKAAALNQSGLTWERYVTGLGGPTAAMEAVQDQIRGHFARAFALAHNALKPDAPLKIGRQTLARSVDHLDMVDPSAREARLTQQRELVESLRTRDRGRYAAGTVAGKLTEAAEQRTAAQQSQLDMFGFDGQEDLPEHAADKPLAADQRHTLGHAAERQLATVIQHVGRNFRPGDQVRLWQPAMEGLQQRAIRMIEANQRVALGVGVGVGKSLASLGSFADLHAKGKVKKGLFLVPSSTVAQMHGEALRYLQPGRFQWHAKPGASHEERLAAMQDPGTHFVVTTHQSFRDDLLKLGAAQAGLDPQDMAEQLRGMSVEERKAWAAKVMDAHGIKPDFMMVDEAHGLLNRRGKENSTLANVLDAVGHNADYHVLASADIGGKNDVSETADMLGKLDPERYGDRDAFLRRYGGDTPAKRDALRREVMPYLIAGSKPPPVAVDRREETVSLNAKQQKVLADLDKAMAAARLGRIKGQPDLQALKTLSPESFEGVPAAEQGAVAERVQKALGTLREAAVRRALDDMGQSAKLDRVSEMAKERQGRPGVIFAHSLDVARDLHERLTQEGHRVGLLTGGQSSEERGAIIKKFNPEAGDPEHDILVMSDAGAVGINAQRGSWLVQYDTPMTSLTHAQRNGRIHRTGQKNDVELIDLIADHPAEHRARERLRKKYALRDVMTDPATGLDETGLAGYLARARMSGKQQELF